VTEPERQDLLALATPYALDAVSSDEQRDIEQQIAGAPEDVVRAFRDEVRAVRETMAVVSATTSVEPPEHLRDRLLAAIGDAPRLSVVSGPNTLAAQPTSPSKSSRSMRWRTVALSAAAAVIIGIGAVGVGVALRPEAKPSAAEQVFEAPDVKTVSGPIPTGGTATVVFSRARNAAVLVMNDVAPPEQGYVYQMWLVAPDGAHSAGTMDAKAVSPSTTAVLPDIDGSEALAFTVEPGTGSTQPTSPVFAELPLI
jgi:anti-sigma-K factor RskA